MSCKQIEQFGKFESRIFTREIKNIKTWAFWQDRSHQTRLGPNFQRDFDVILKKGTIPNSLMIADGTKKLGTKKVGFSVYIGSSCNFYLHFFF